MLTRTGMFVSAGLLFLTLLLGAGLLSARGSSDPTDIFNRVQTVAPGRAIAVGDGAAVRALVGDGTANRDAVLMLLQVAAQISDHARLLTLLEAGADPTIRNRAGKTFAPFFAITPKESMLNAETKAAQQAVRDWLDVHGYAEVLQ